jgi:hypothetical protein
MPYLQHRSIDSGRSCIRDEPSLGAIIEPTFAIHSSNTRGSVVECSPWDVGDEGSNPVRVILLHFGITEEIFLWNHSN